MATQTPVLPDGTRLTKPALNERYSLSVTNTNTDNIANNIIAMNNQITNIQNAQTILGNSGAHNSVYRGKYLGTSVTSGQWTAISDGTFNDLFIGDYWTINGYNWRIAAFDYWFHKGRNSCVDHHVVIVPDTCLIDPDDNTPLLHHDNSTAGGYVGTDFYAGTNGNTARAQCRSKIQSAFGSSHILTHENYFSTAATNGITTSGGWFSSDIDLMNEYMLYGHSVQQPVWDGSNNMFGHSMDIAVLPLFMLDSRQLVGLRSDNVNYRVNWFLRDISDVTSFCVVNGNGLASTGRASSTGDGIRPVFAIK